MRLLAIDGSNAILAKYKTIEEEFGITKFGLYADRPLSVAKISILYDVLNLTILNAKIDKYDISERKLVRRHFEFVEQAPICFYMTGLFELGINV